MYLFTRLCTEMATFWALVIREPDFRDFGPLSRKGNFFTGSVRRSRIWHRHLRGLCRFAVFRPNLHTAAKAFQRAPIETSTPPFCSIWCVDSESGIDASSGSAELRPLGQIFAWLQRPSTSTNRDVDTTILQHFVRRF